MTTLRESARERERERENKRERESARARERESDRHTDREREKERESERERERASERGRESRRARERARISPSDVERIGAYKPVVPETGAWLSGEKKLKCLRCSLFGSGPDLSFAPLQILLEFERSVRVPRMWTFRSS